ncbi:MAG: hypothetical protein PVH18_09670, partial [Chloroflexota bacterium]
MISFYEYVKSREGLQYTQEQFLMTHPYYRPVMGFREESVLDAYKLFASNWHSSTPPVPNSAGVQATWMSVR